MATYRMMGPNGPMETEATSPSKAWSNFRWRLAYGYGMGMYRAARYDHSDMRETARDMK